MSMITSIFSGLDRTATAVFGSEVHRSERVTRSLRVSATAATRASDGPSDPEEALLSRLRAADQAKHRAEAHARIMIKRQANPSVLRELLSRPEYRIEVDSTLLKEILEAYPEDE